MANNNIDRMQREMAAKSEEIAPFVCYKTDILACS